MLTMISHQTLLLTDDVKVATADYKKKNGKAW